MITLTLWEKFMVSVSVTSRIPRKERSLLAARHKYGMPLSRSYIPSNRPEAVTAGFERSALWYWIPKDGH